MNPSSYLNQANNLRRLGKYTEVIELYHRAIQEHDNFAMFYSGLGEVLAQLGKWDEAIANFASACELNPNSPWFYYDLGEALAKQERVDEAITAYQQAIALLPRAEFYNGLGETLAIQDKGDEAIACWKKAIEVDSRFSKSYINLGDTLSKQGRLKEAINFYRSGIELKPFYLYYEKLGNVLTNQGLISSAIIAYNNAIRLKSDAGWQPSGLKEAEAKQKQWEETLVAHHKNLQGMSNFTSDFYGFYNSLGHALFEGKESNGEKAPYWEAVDKLPSEKTIFPLNGVSPALVLKKTVAVIGNSANILANNYGEEIDMYDDVIRFNLPTISGFEKNVGSKTTLLFFGGLLEAVYLQESKSVQTTESELFIEEYKKILGSTEAQMKGAEFLLYRFPDLPIVTLQGERPRTIKIIEPNRKIYLITPIFTMKNSFNVWDGHSANVLLENFCGLKNKIGNKKVLTTGLMMVLRLIVSGIQPVLYGFDTNIQKEFYDTYYHQMKGLVVKQHHHDISGERLVLKELAECGYINVK